MKKLGLALCAGGARGACQVGLLKALEENGIKPCCVSGSSSGAIIGAAVACGMSAEEMAQALKKIGVLSIVRPLPNLLRSGIFSTRRACREFAKYFGEKRIGDLQMPFCCVATELGTGRAHVFDESVKVVDAVMASCCIPAIFKPFVIDGVAYVDGGLTANMPVEQLRTFEPDVIIAAGAGSSQSEERHFGSFVGVLWQMYEIMNDGSEIMRREAQAPDLVIDSGIKDMKLYEVKRMGEAISAGYDSAIREMESIKELLR